MDDRAPQDPRLPSSEHPSPERRKGVAAAIHRPRVLLVGRMQGWMRLHLEQLQAALRAAGADCEIADHRRLATGGFMRRFGGRDRSRILRRRTDALIDLAREWRPDVILTYTALDYERLAEGARSRIAIWDWERLIDVEKPDLGVPSGVDMIFTISRTAERALLQRNSVPALYLPHGVDTDFWSPGPNRGSASARSPLTFIGRPSERRIDHLEPLADLGLAVWGRRWHRSASPALRACARGKEDVIGRELVGVYRESDVVLNVLRLEPSDHFSLQVFQAPSMGKCLITEWMPGLDEVFEPGVELVAYRTVEELRELAERYVRDREAARRIGEAGRRRCVSDHAQVLRARRLLESVRELD